ncbi:hypothetical protein PPYR_13466 [Photinus pyralis]|uniref:Innexin n=1 Tax=Photinus pyralis TaxID=7054 RepID=A0A5N4A936_PHOPY|nr:innexin inx2-like [Photinus pyralis]KAB0793846.1 hypothetical protein PPYR_13466 [Photinus pyralis]
MKIMLDFLNSFKSLIKLETIHTDNNIFKLHYRFTVIMLIVFSILITSKQYFGDPINCDVEHDRKSVVDTYCWIFGTFRIKSTVAESIWPGLGNYVDMRHAGNAWKEIMKSSELDDVIISQKYYQWICIVLCFQALLFYTPRYLWKTWEGGRLRLLVKDLGSPLVSASWTGESKDKLVGYVLAGKYSHNLYCLRFTACEILNFVNVIGQILLMDWLLSYQFSDYGLSLLTTNAFETMNRVFPKLTKCTYGKFGPSGSVETRDALCILPINVVNEKLFIFIWLWFYLLTLLSAFAIIYRVLMICVPQVRVYLLMAQARYISRSHAEAIVRRLTYGDYFLVYQMGKNLNPLVYKDLIDGIGSVLKGSKPYNPEVTFPI